jgi:hypothetical protein
MINIEKYQRIVLMEISKIWKYFKRNRTEVLEFAFNAKCLSQIDPIIAGYVIAVF